MVKAANLQEVRIDERVCDLAFYYDKDTEQVTNVIDRDTEWNPEDLSVERLLIGQIIIPEFV